MLKQKVFSVKASSSSQTKCCRVGYRSFEDIELVVCDCIGQLDTENDFDVVRTENARAIDMARPGPHAFLINFKIGNRMTGDEMKTIEEIQDIFGKDASKYCILILTAEDQLSEDETFDDYLESATPDLQQLLAQCQNRYITFSEYAEQEVIDDKIRQLLKIIKRMLVDNQTKYYSKEELQRAAQALQEREEAALKAKTIEKEKEQQSLREEVLPITSHHINNLSFLL
jgi:ATP-dependent Lon protease